MARRFRVSRVSRPHSKDPEPLKVGLVLSGAVALGSYEAGVVSEVMKAVASGAPLTVDIVVGSSAGAIIGATVTRSLVMGAPFEDALEGWTGSTLEELTSGYERPAMAKERGKPLDRGILSSEAIRRILQRQIVMEPVRRDFQPAYPASQVIFAVTLANLDGLSGAGTPEDAAQFSEAVIFPFTLKNPHNLSESEYLESVWRRVALTCKASAAFPGAFDHEYIPWAQRVQIPGLVEEYWENEPVIARLNETDQTLQPKMRYADGGILDEQPLERAINLLPLVTGESGVNGQSALLYDARRCILFVEPDPEPTSPATLRAGTPQSWLQSFSRAIQLWTRPTTSSQKRVLMANNRQERLFQFLSKLARQMREEKRAPSAQQVVAQFWRHYPTSDDEWDAGAAEKAGAPTVDPERFRGAVRSFYAWLRDGLPKDMQWLDRLPNTRIRSVHTGVRAALLELREAYIALEGMDPNEPGRYQAILEETHLSLAAGLGLSQPWVALHRITPDEPAKVLQGEGLAHFAGFFSRDFLRHDFEVGRYNAHLWLSQVIPGYSPADPPVMPQAAGKGLTWRHIWENHRPLVRIVGRLAAVLLETAGIKYGGVGQFLVTLLGWSLPPFVLIGTMLLLGSWFGWGTLPPMFQPYRFWILTALSLFPLTFLLVLVLVLRSGVIREVWQWLNSRI